VIAPPTTLSFRVDGKRAMVSGVSRGIGLAAAVTEAGAHVTCMARDERDLQAVVNAAGMARDGPALETDEFDDRQVMEVNLCGAYLPSARAAKGMIEAGRPGSIIHVSSRMRHVGGVDRAVHGASKHGLKGLCKSMAIEWGPHDVRIDTISPTSIRTPLTRATFADPERVARIRSTIKLPRLGEVADVMGAVVHLACDVSRLVTGTALLVDGGWTTGRAV